MFGVRLATSPLLRRSAVALAVLVSGAAAQAALPPFTLNPAAAGLENFDALRSQNVGPGKDVRPSAVAANPQGEDRRMFDEQQRVVDVIGFPLFNQGAL